jgi:zinc transporter ZupT
MTDTHPKGPKPIHSNHTAVGIDLCVDGMLLGLIFAQVGTQGNVFLLALVLEVLVLGLGSVVTLTRKGLRAVHAIVTMAVLGALIPLPALMAARVMSLEPHDYKIGFLAFGIAALLDLVVEVLFVEAHEGVEDNAVMTATFFAGFLVAA